MTADAEVLKASEQFYAALNRTANGDASAMPEIWSHSADVTTMHPIGGREAGWNQVRGSWEQVAKLATAGQVRLVDQLIHVSGDLACEVGVERGKVTMVGQEAPFDHRVTNVYRREGGKWKIVHHHTDVAPEMLEVLQSILSENVKELQRSVDEYCSSPQWDASLGKLQVRGPFNLDTRHRQNINKTGCYVLYWEDGSRRYTGMSEKRTMLTRINEHLSAREQRDKFWSYGLPVRYACTIETSGEKAKDLETFLRKKKAIYYSKGQSFAVERKDDDSFDLIPFDYDMYKQPAIMKNMERTPLINLDRTAMKKLIRALRVNAEKYWGKGWD
jgi:ketosteroid isomerase-like protein